MEKLTYDKDLHIFLDAEGNPATQEDKLIWVAENPVVTHKNGEEEVVNIHDQAREIIDHMEKNNVDPSLILDIANKMNQGQSAQNIIANLFNPKIPVQMPEQNVQEPLQPTDLITEDQNYGY